MATLTPYQIVTEDGAAYALNPIGIGTLYLREEVDEVVAQLKSELAITQDLVRKINAAEAREAALKLILDGVDHSSDDYHQWGLNRMFSEVAHQRNIVRRDRDRLARQNALLLACVQAYANEENWGPIYQGWKDLLYFDCENITNGFEPAQTCLAQLKE